MCFLVLLTHERRNLPPFGCFPTTLTQTCVLMPALVAGPAAASDGGALPPVSVLWRRLQTGQQRNPEWSGGQDLAPEGQPNLLGVCPQLDPTPTASQPRRPQTVQGPYPDTHRCQTTPTGHAHQPSPASLPSLLLPPPLSPPALLSPQPKLAPPAQLSPQPEALGPAPLPASTSVWPLGTSPTRGQHSPDPALEVPTRPLQFSPLTQELTAPSSSGTTRKEPTYCLRTIVLGAPLNRSPLRSSNRFGP